jgi:hypothetical protein
MMKKLMTVVAVASLGGLAVAARVGVAPPHAIAAGSCGGGRTLAAADAAALRSGPSVAAAEGGAIAILHDGQTTLVAPPDHDTGVLRHVSSRSGVGTAYVRDRAGGDVVVAETSSGVRRFATRGEALQPSLSVDGKLVWAQGTGLRIAAPGSTKARRVAGPSHAGLAFSPSFDVDGTIVAGIVSPPTRAVPDDEYRSNLWRYLPGTHRWIQLTRFRGGVDRWSIVRTPFVAPDGSIQFVRVHGRASQDRAPSFELWQILDGVTTELRPLPGEMYLAGFDGAARLWNLRDGTTGSWRIDREQQDGRLEPAGCGAVAVDPLDRPDPDRRPGTRWAPLSPQRSASDTEQDATMSSSAVDAILVGDFSSSEAAADAATRIRIAFGSLANVVDAAQAPTVVRPGVWAVIVPLTTDDAEADLARFRAAMPDLAGWSWIVSI